MDASPEPEFFPTAPSGRSTGARRRGPGKPQSCLRGNSSGISLALLGSSLRHLGGFDDADGAVRIDKGCVGNTTDIRFTHLVNPVHLAEKFTPVAPQRLILAQLEGESLV